MRQQQNNAQVRSAGYKPAIIILTNLMERAKKEAIREKRERKGARREGNTKKQTIRKNKEAMEKSGGSSRREGRRNCK